MNARTIQLGSGDTALVDAADYDRVLEAGPWHIRRAAFASYAQHHISRPHKRRTTEPMHVFILGFKGIDHINGDGLDNRRANLRPATRSQNGANKPSRSGVSEFKGVSWHRARSVWIAQISVDQVRRHLGSFTTEKAAALAYDEAARTAWGEYARPNFPDITTGPPEAERMRRLASNYRKTNAGIGETTDTRSSDHLIGALTT